MYSCIRSHTHSEIQIMDGDFLFLVTNLTHHPEAKIYSEHYFTLVVVFPLQQRVTATVYEERCVYLLHGDGPRLHAGQRLRWGGLLVSREHPGNHWGRHIWLHRPQTPHTTPHAAEEGGK